MKGAYYLYKLNNSYTIQTEPSAQLHEGLLLRKATLSQCVDYLATNCTITSKILFNCQNGTVNVATRFVGTNIKANKEALKTTILNAYWKEVKAIEEAKAKKTQGRRANFGGKF